MLVVGSLAGGLALVALLVVPRKGLILLLATVAAGVVASFAGIFAISMGYDRIDVALISALMGLLLLGLAYSTGTAILPRMLRARPAPALGAHQPSAPRAAVILSTCVEPESYRPRSFARTLREYEATGVPLPGWSARPMLFAAERARYHGVGDTSPARTMCRTIAEALETALERDGRSYAGGVAWCTGFPGLDDIVATAVNEGASRIVVVQHAVAESVRTDRARSAVDALELPERGIRVTYTPPLWGSLVLVERVVSRIITALTDRDPESVGVCLVGHGQPPEWHDRNPAMTEQETYFHQRVRSHLTDHGVPGGNVKLAWLDWSEPDVTETVRHLAARGSRFVLVVPSAMPVDSLSTLVDLRHAVALARVPESAEVAILDAWGHDEAIVGELAERVRQALNES